MPRHARSLVKSEPDSQRSRRCSFQTITTKQRMATDKAATMADSTPENHQPSPAARDVQNKSERMGMSMLNFDDQAPGEPVNR